MISVFALVLHIHILTGKVRVVKIPQTNCHTMMLGLFRGPGGLVLADYPTLLIWFGPKNWKSMPSLHNNSRKCIFLNFYENTTTSYLPSVLNRGLRFCPCSLTQCWPEDLISSVNYETCSLTWKLDYLCLRNILNFWLSLALYTNVYTNITR